MIVLFARRNNFCIFVNVLFWSKNSRASVLTKVQKDAKARGIELPPVFTNIDDESGMPSLFAHDVSEKTLGVTVEEAIQEQIDAAQLTLINTPNEPSLPKTVFYDAGAQTYCLLL